MTDKTSYAQNAPGWRVWQKAKDLFKSLPPREADFDSFFMSVEDVLLIFGYPMFSYRIVYTEVKSLQERHGKK